MTAANASLDDREAGELGTLLEVARAVSSTLELEPLLELVLDQLKAVADYAGASVCSVERDELRILASRGATRADRETEAIGLRAPLLRGGPLWDALSRHEAVIITDARGDGELGRAYRAWLGEEADAPAFGYVRSSLMVPLVAHDRVIGLISLSKREPGYYTQHHARLATAIAGHVALALENARLYARARDEERRTAALARIASTVALAGSLETILRRLAQSVVEATGADACAVVTAEGDPPRPRYAGAYGLPEGYGAAMAEAVQRGADVLSFGALADKQPIVRRNVWPELLARPEFAPIHGFHEQVQWDTVIAAPMIARGATVGTLSCYYRRDREPDEEEVAFQGTIASQAAVAVENARLFADAQEKASLEERARLARDLHDSATQTVFSVGMLAQAARTQHQRGSERLGETLDRVAALSQQAHAEMRALLFELRPDALTDEGLAQALGRLVDAVQTRSGLAVRLSGAVPAEVRSERATAIFRIVQEALNNAVKHARATEMNVSVAAREGGWLLVVQDNGVGFDGAAAAERAAQGGLGMRSMRERATAADLGLRISSAPGAGTTVELSVPGSIGEQVPPLSQDSGRD